jgi:hypothetical protein
VLGSKTVHLVQAAGGGKSISAKNSEVKRPSKAEKRPLSRVISTNFLHFHSLSLSPQRRTVVCLDVTSTQFLPLTNAGELDLAGFTTNASPRQSDESSIRGCCKGISYGFDSV